MFETAPFRVRVRRARERDARPCANIFLRAREVAFRDGAIRTFDLEDYHRSVTEDEVWVAVQERRVVGFVSIYRPDSQIRHLFVDPGWQHRGIGSRLLSRARAELHGPATLSCLASNRAACAFYERNGWIPEQSWQSKWVIYRK